MPKVKTPKKLSKSDFVRQQPSTLTAPEVVKKAKAAGIKLSTQLVYVVRGRGNGKGTAKRTPTAKPTALPTSGKTTSKAAFVRALPASTPAKDVVKQAKAAGIKLGISYVYNIRGAAKMAAKKKRAAAKSQAVSAIVNGGASKVSASVENLLKAVATEIGLGRAIELLHGERGWVHSIMRG